MRFFTRWDLNKNKHLGFYATNQVFPLTLLSEAISVENKER